MKTNQSDQHKRIVPAEPAHDEGPDAKASQGRDPLQDHEEDGGSSIAVADVVVNHFLHHSDQSVLLDRPDASETDMSRAQAGFAVGRES